MNPGKKKRDVIVLRAGDDAAVVLRPLERGERIVVQPGEAVQHLSVQEPVPGFHKIALRDIGAGEAVVRGGIVIGEATSAIAAGGWIHIHNLVSRRARRSAAPSPDQSSKGHEQ